MNKIMKLFKDFLKDRTIMFYVALGTAVLSIITAIINVSALHHLAAYFSWIPFVLMLVGALAFAAGALFRYTRIGAGVMAALNFVALLVYIATIYGWPVEQIMNGLVSELPMIIVSAVLMLVCMIVSNVCAWMSLQKTTTAASTAEN